FRRILTGPVRGYRRPFRTGDETPETDLLEKPQRLEQNRQHDSHRRQHRNQRGQKQQTGDDAVNGIASPQRRLDLFQRPDQACSGGSQTQRKDERRRRQHQSQQIGDNGDQTDGQRRQRHPAGNVSAILTRQRVQFHTARGGGQRPAATEVPSHNGQWNQAAAENDQSQIG